MFEEYRADLGVLGAKGVEILNQCLEDALNLISAPNAPRLVIFLCDQKFVLLEQECVQAETGDGSTEAQKKEELPLRGDVIFLGGRASLTTGCRLGLCCPATGVGGMGHQLFFLAGAFAGSGFSGWGGGGVGRPYFCRIGKMAGCF